MDANGDLRHVWVSSQVRTFSLVHLVRCWFVPLRISKHGSMVSLSGLLFSFIVLLFDAPISV